MLQKKVTNWLVLCLLIWAKRLLCIFGVNINRFLHLFRCLPAHKLQFRLKCNQMESARFMEKNSVMFYCERFYRDKLFQIIRNSHQITQKIYVESTRLKIDKLPNLMDFLLLFMSFDSIRFISRCTREITLERQKALDTFPLSKK